MPHTMKQRELIQRKHNSLPNNDEVMRVRRRLAELRVSRAATRLATK
jgi:hypothetical protein